MCNELACIGPDTFVWTGSSTTILQYLQKFLHAHWLISLLISGQTHEFIISATFTNIEREQFEDL